LPESNASLLIFLDSFSIILRQRFCFSHFKRANQIKPSWFFQKETLLAHYKERAKNYSIKYLVERKLTQGAIFLRAKPSFGEAGRPKQR